FGALAVWVLVLSGALTAAVWSGGGTWLAIPLWTVALTPLVLLILSLRKHTSRARRRMGRRWSIPFPLASGILIGLAISLLVVIRILNEADASLHGASFPIFLAPMLSTAVIGGLCA